LTRNALINVSNRFGAIQQLINAIPSAEDAKGVMDLQARIQAELGMLQNEQTKIQILQQVAQADDAVRHQREWEIAVAGRGRFATRFQPTP
jgi:type IV secretion system protein VirB5